MQTIAIWAAIGLVFFILTNFAFIDLMHRDFGSTGKKATWGLIALIPFIGFAVYMVFGMRQGIKIDYNAGPPNNDD